MFPLRDENPTIRIPYAVIAVIIINALVWFFVQGFGGERDLAQSLCLYALIPGDLLGLVNEGTRVQVSANLACALDGSPNPTSLVTSMFMHGGWFHILGNMWFLWVFGDNIEDVMGPVRFVVFYI